MKPDDERTRRRRGKKNKKAKGPGLLELVLACVQSKATRQQQGSPGSDVIKTKEEKCNRFESIQAMDAGNFSSHTLLLGCRAVQPHRSLCVPRVSIILSNLVRALVRLRFGWGPPPLSRRASSPRRRSPCRDRGRGALPRPTINNTEEKPCSVPIHALLERQLVQIFQLHQHLHAGEVRVQHRPRGGITSADEADSLQDHARGERLLVRPPHDPGRQVLERTHAQGFGTGRRAAT